MVLQNAGTIEQADDSSFPLTLAGSLLATGLAISLVVQHPIRALGWRGSAAFTLIYIVFAAAVHSGAVIVVRAAFREHMHARLTRLLWAIWIPVAWLPLLGVLTVKDSAWVLAVFPILSIAATALLTQERLHPTPEELDHDTTGLHLLLPPDVALLRRLAPSLATAALLQGGLACMAAGHDWFAGLLFALACVLPAARLLERTRGLGTIRIAAATSVAVFVLTWVALLPMLLAAQFGAGVPGMAQSLHRPSLLPERRAGSSSSGYSGIILLPPVPKHKALLLPRLENYSGTPTRHKQDPTIIPFDGQYWYFKAPDVQPQPDARVVHADPLKANIRSTDPLPVSMEAHQLFPLPLPLQAASTMKVDLVNADTRPGAITVEVLVRSRTLSKTRISLGTAVLASSTSPSLNLNRAPVHESLRFAIPRRLRGKAIDEISVRLIPEASRARGGAEVAIQDFALLP